MGLSACLIVKDEAKNIKRCLDGLKAFADEIIVVDTGSTDGTPDIVREEIGRVYFHVWQDDFSAARNMSISLATKEWIIWVDADDTFPQHTVDLLNFVKKSDDYSKFFSCVVRNVNPTKMEWVQKKEFYQCRLFPNYKGVTFSKRVHETFSQNALDLGLKHWTCDEMVIKHHGYQDVALLELKRKRNIRLTMMDIGFPPKSDFYEFDIGNFFCVYVPNILAIWYDMTLLTTVDPFIDGLPDTVIDRQGKLYSIANREIVKRLFPEKPLKDGTLAKHDMDKINDQFK